MITTVIFDIGNVLAAYDWEDALKRLGYSEETREIIGNAVFSEVQTGMRWTGAF